MKEKSYRYIKKAREDICGAQVFKRWRSESEVQYQCIRIVHSEQEEFLRYLDPHKNVSVSIS